MLDLVNISNPEKIIFKDTTTQKKLGAFYTPEPYCQLGAELVRKAIERVPAGHDYVIIDRCAGIGNLESVLTDDELRHTIISTYELEEFFVLDNRLGKKVRSVIAPIVSDGGKIKCVDALEALYYERLEKVIEDTKQAENVTRIVFENPPYADATLMRKQDPFSISWKETYVVKHMKEYIREHPEILPTASNDIANAFIWSSFEYILKEPTDSLIVYSPVKYWKAQHLINKKFMQGYAVNRKHFNTKTNAMIMLALWSNEDKEEEQLVLNAKDIKKGELVDEGMIQIKPIHSLYSETYYDKRKFKDDTYDGIAVEFNGLETIKPLEKQTISKIYNKNILGYLLAKTSNFDMPRLSSNLVIAGKYEGHGFYLREDNFVEKLPVFVASRYTDNIHNWKIMSCLMKSGDGKDRYEQDVKDGKLDDFLCKCLIWTCLSHYPHMRSQIGSDKRLYINQLCFDGDDTIASKTIKQFIDDGYVLTEEEKELFKVWQGILHKTKESKLYNKNFKYGLYQIDEEINIKNEDKTRQDLDLNKLITTLKNKLKEYYRNNLTEKLFEYEFVK